MNRFFSLALVAALLSGLVFAWWASYWAVVIAVAALSVVGIAGALLMRETHFDWRLIPVVLIGLWTPAQLLRGASVLPSLSEREAIYWGAGSLGFILASQTLRSRSTRDLFLKALLATSQVLAVLAVIQKYAFPHMILGIFSGPGTAFGTFYYQNQFAALMEISAPIALWRILRGHEFYGGVAYAILLGATLVSGSRAGVILVLLELAVFLVIALSARRVSFAAVGLIFALVVITGSIMGTDIIRGRFQTNAPEVVRLDLAKSTLRMIRQRPWSGFGMGTWRRVYPRFATFDIDLLANEAHDDWLQWAEEGGVVFSGLVAVLALSLAAPALRCFWGLGFLIVLMHSFVDYVLREPALALVWFVVGGAILAYETGRQADHPAAPV